MRYTLREMPLNSQHPDSPRRFRAEDLILLGIVLLALMLRVPTDPDRFFWGDEAWRAYLIYKTDSLSGFLQLARKIGCWLQLSEYVSARIGVALFRDWSFALLLWPVLWGVLAVLGAYRLLERISGRSAALAGAVLIAVGPDFILHSREFKPYSLDLAMTLWVLSTAVSGGERRRHDVHLVGLLSVFACSSLTFTFVYPAVVAYRLYRADGIRLPVLVHYSIPGWVFLIYFQFFLRAQDFSKPLAHGPFANLYLNIDNLSNVVAGAASSIPRFVVVGWLLTVIFYFIVTPALSLRKGDGLFVLFLAPFFAQSGLSMLGKYPMFHRPSTYLYGVMAVSLVYGLDGACRMAFSRLASRQQRVLFVSLLSGIVAISACTTGPSGAIYREVSAYPEDPGKSACQTLASRFRTGDKVMLSFGFTYVFELHKRDVFKGVPEIKSISVGDIYRQHRLVDRSAEELCISFKEMSRDLREGDRVWIISHRIRPYRRVLQPLGKLEVLIHEKRQGLMLFEFERPPTTLECPENREGSS